MNETTDDTTKQTNDLALEKIKADLSRELAQIEEEMDKYEYKVKFIYDFHVASFNLAAAFCGTIATAIMTFQSPGFIPVAGLVLMGLWTLNSLRHVLIKKPTLEFHLK